jgi:hypothetical protein
MKTNNVPRIDETQLSKNSKDFIDRFKRMNQEKYDELFDKVTTSNRPITRDQVEFIMR